MKCFDWNKKRRCTALNVRKIYTTYNYDDSNYVNNFKVWEDVTNKKIHGDEY